MVKKLVEKGANIYARTNWGYTALFYAVIKDANKANACKKGGLEIVKHLVEHGSGLHLVQKNVEDVAKDKAIKQYLSELP